jgi:hypothetical protein
VRFRMRHPDGDNYDGVVAQIKPGFIVLSEERDFEFDGTLILAKKFIKGCRDGKHERCENEILRENSALRKCRSPRWLDRCETLFDVATQLMKRDIWPGVEIIFDKNTARISAAYAGGAIHAHHSIKLPIGYVVGQSI